MPRRNVEGTLASQHSMDTHDTGPEENTLARGSVRRKWHTDFLRGQCILGTRVRLLEYLSPRLYEVVDSTYACVSTYLDVVYIAADGRLLEAPDKRQNEAVMRRMTLRTR